MTTDKLITSLEKSFKGTRFHLSFQGDVISITDQKDGGVYVDWYIDDKTNEGFSHETLKSYIDDNFKNEKWLCSDKIKQEYFELMKILKSVIYNRELKFKRILQ